MTDEFKKIKFRNNGKVYTAGVINLTGLNVDVQAQFMVCIAAMRIYEEGEEETLGGIMFHQSTLLNYLWAEPHKKRFPDEEHLEEALVNLLHYLPLKREDLIPHGSSFIYRFTRDREDGLEVGQRIFNIKVEESMENTYKKIMFDEEITDEKIYKAILEPLYMHRKNSFNTNLLIKLLRSIFPFSQNETDSHLEFLEYKGFIEILKDTSGAFVSVKITPKGQEFLLGQLPDRLTDMAKVHVGHNFNIKTGDNSPVNIKADIDSDFEEIKKELEEKNPGNKTELLKDLNELRKEIKEPKDLNKIKTLLRNLGTGAAWISQRIEPIVQQVIAAYISNQFPK